jgi:hypothetical protein
MEIPAGVSFNGVETAFLEFEKAVIPVFTGNTEIVHRT